MADSHLQVNHDGSLETRKTVLWGTSESDRKEVLLQIFSQPNWRVDRLDHIDGSFWKVETSSHNISYKINLYVSSVRDEARQPDEYKMQLGAITPIVEDGWITLIMGIYTISEGTESNEYILSAYNKDRFHFETNPSIRGTRTGGLQIAKILGFYKTDISYLFRPEFIYYYIENQEELNNKANETTIKNEVHKAGELPQSLQVIYYGAPGTGKSHIVKKQTEGESVVRTTFHPDSDYSTFVGCYKPTTKEIEMRDVTGKVIIENDLPVTENRIIYQFVDQAFLQAYIKAWKFYTETLEGADPKKQFLIIEEINRGNCAQIFGDLFQLLDRNDSGFSEYFIHADKDMQKHLSNAFKDCLIKDSHKDAINSLYSKEDDVVAKVLSGEILLLPNNLYIWATMNTSDQSLFPIDSAFKRRWDWKYRPIVKGRDRDGRELNWRITANTREYDWWSFLEKINAIVGTTTNSEDKKLGFFFCKSIDGVISTETFVGKVIFYLWNDVFKNFGFDDPIFKDEDSSTLEFDKFYTTNADGDTMVRADKVEKFLDNLQVKVVGEVIVDIEDEDGNTSSSSTRDYTKYSINGVGKHGKNRLAAECVKEYIKQNPTMSAEEVLANWKGLGYFVPHFIESLEEHNARTDNSKRSTELKCGGTVVYVEHNGYGSNGAVDRLIAAINEKDWNIRIEKAE